MNTPSDLHPRSVLLAASTKTLSLPTCDHYSGLEARMLKSLQLQREMSQEFGVCMFDVTLDCVDGAPAGSEGSQAALVRDLALDAQSEAKKQGLEGKCRVGVRVHDINNPYFSSDVVDILKDASDAFSYVTIPMVESLEDLHKAQYLVDMVDKRLTPMPLHVLIESEKAVHNAFALAEHSRVESLSFGVMDFVSGHGGVVPANAMGVDEHETVQSLDQFSHPLVVRAKLRVSAAAHAWGKVPSHSVIREFRNEALLRRSACTASKKFGFMRMWSIHPDQIRPIVESFTPETREIKMATEVILTALDHAWAPIALYGRLHDRSSYRYCWHVLELAHKTGCALAPEIVELILSDECV